MVEVDLQIRPRVETERASALVGAEAEQPLGAEDTSPAGLAASDPLHLAQFLERVDPHVRVRPDAERDAAVLDPRGRKEPVGEFHYLGVDEARAAAAAAAEAGVELVLLLAAYARGGLPRMRQSSAAEYLSQLESLRDDGLRVGLAPHSVRACPRDWLEEIGRYAASQGLPLHIHACEQPREIEECLAEHGCRPIELLARTGCLGPHVTVVHATHADGSELDLLAESSTTVCACPTTEADLADGFLPAARIEHRGIPLCIGSDSNVRIDPLEELRELEGIARRQTGKRGVFSTDRLLRFGADEGARALGLGSWPAIGVDPGHDALRGVARADVLDALVSSCSADVVSRA